jgi:NTE family protein
VLSGESGDRDPVPARTTIEADGVFSAGGIRALAIAGAVLECSENESVRVERWRNVAGTSGGAITAAYLAAGHTPAELLEMLHRVPAPEYGPGGRFIGGALNLIRRHGLTLGAHFQKWFDNELDFLTFGTLRSQPVNGTEPEHRYRLRMVAADITNRRILVLPDDLGDYRLLGNDGPIVPDEFRVAHAVRMSISIPYLVDPAHLLDATGRMVTIVDGGVVSSFPLWLFDTQHADPRRPTLGLRLAPPPARRRPLPGPAWPLGMALDIARTPADAWERHMLAEATTLRTCMIDAGAIASTNFRASREQRAELIHRGRLAAREFLREFDLGRYRNAHGRRMTGIASDSQA